MTQKIFHILKRVLDAPDWSTFVSDNSGPLWISSVLYFIIYNVYTYSFLDIILTLMKCQNEHIWNNLVYFWLWYSTKLIIVGRGGGGYGGNNSAWLHGVVWPFNAASDNVTAHWHMIVLIYILYLNIHRVCWHINVYSALDPFRSDNVFALNIVPFL